MSKINEDLKKLAENALKLAEQMKQRLTDNFVSVDLSHLQKAANVLAESGWIENDEESRKTAIEVLKNPVQVLDLLSDLATKSASEIANLKRELKNVDSVLESGSRFVDEYRTKYASDMTKEAKYVGNRLENEHDREFLNRVLAARSQLDYFRNGLQV